MRLTARKFPYDGITQQVQRVTDGISLYLSRVPPAPLWSCAVSSLTVIPYPAGKCKTRQKNLSPPIDGVFPL